VEAERRRLIDFALSESRVQSALRDGDLDRDGIAEAVEIALKRDNTVDEAFHSLAEARNTARQLERLWRPLLARWLAPLGAHPLVVALIVSALAFVGAFVIFLGEEFEPDESALLAAFFAFAVGMAIGPACFLLGSVRTLAFRRVRAARKAVKDLERDLLGRQVLPELRAHMMDRPFNRLLSPIDTRGLGSLFDPRYEVQVAATEKLKTTLNELEAGSIGIAGSRGAGKTTLIRVACSGGFEIRRGEEKFPARGVMVSAPVRYEARDFIRYLFEELCLSVLPKTRAEKELMAMSRRYRRIRLWVLVLAQVVAFGMLIFSLVLGGGLLARFLLPAGPIVLGLLFSLGWVRRWGIETELEKTAKQNLRQLRYLETISKDWSGEVAAKGGKLGMKRTVSRAEQAWTLPDLIKQYQDFLGLLTESRPIVIGIDELDKMRDVEEARGFLNDMKSLFDQPNVYYLVSISEDALSDFERRGQPLRDVFDSVFSDVIHVGCLNQKESNLLLKRRAIGVPPPWPALFHTLSGGLPRESLRVARQAMRFGTDERLDAVTARLVAERALSVEHAASVIASRYVQSDGTQPVLEWLRSLPSLHPATLNRGKEADEVALALRARLQVEDVAAELRAEGGDEETDRQMERLVMELAASSHHSLTCLEFFGVLDADGFSRACADHPYSENGIDLLARGQRDLSMSPALSWRTVSEFRARVKLDRHPYPS
jgi:hypothetical protein